MVLGMTLKFCNKCSQEKTINDFYADKRSKDGLQSKCISCELQYRKNNAERIKARKREYNNKNKEKNRQYFKEYRKNNKDKISIFQKNYQLENAEKIKKQRFEYRENHRQELRQKTKEYKKANPHIVNNYILSRKARKKLNGVFYISAKELQKLYLSDCFYCGDNENIQIDHVVPISKGGTHSIGNLVPACAECNLSKRDKFLSQWKLQKI